MENQRIRLTRKMLKEALVRLLEYKTIDKITVYELCAEAEINRTTFYKYYGSQYDLMADIQGDFLRELENSLREENRPVSLLYILTYIDTHRDSCTALLRSAASDGFLERILSLSLITEQLEQQLSPRYSGFENDYVREFITFGAYSIVRRWLMSEQPEPPECISKLIIDLIEKI
ncbi:MAG: TetR/AcrR family transcriptional regulator [Ruminococcus sp.]|nr:TetR/AcrR family transcriptional regulator [Ruminococcus sp.]